MNVFSLRLEGKVEDSGSRTIDWLIDESPRSFRPRRNKNSDRLIVCFFVKLCCNGMGKSALCNPLKSNYLKSDAMEMSSIDSMALAHTPHPIPAILLHFLLP